MNKETELVAPPDASCLCMLALSLPLMLPGRHSILYCGLVVQCMVRFLLLKAKTDSFIHSDFSNPNELTSAAGSRRDPAVKS